MFDFIKDIFRKRQLKKFASDIQTGLLPMDKIAAASFVISVEEPEFDALQEDIMAWGRQCGIKTSIYFFDFRKIGKEELLLTSIQTTILKRELDWIGTPEISKVMSLLGEPSDLFVSLIDNGDFPIEFLGKCAKARFKMGRTEYSGHPYDMIISGNQTAELRSDARKIFGAMTEFLKKIN